MYYIKVYYSVLQTYTTVYYKHVASYVKAVMADGLHVLCQSKCKPKQAAV